MENLTKNKIALDSIKGLINREYLEKTIEVNTDPYSKACVDVALNVLQYLDNFNSEFNIVGYFPDLTTTHGIICECDNQGGITGAMAGAVTNIVAMCHILGWKFYLAHIMNEYNYKDEKVINRCIQNVVSKNLTDENTAKKYIEESIKRAEIRQKEAGELK